MEEIYAGKDDGKLIKSDKQYKNHMKAEEVREDSVTTFTSKAQKAIEEAEALEKEFEQLEKKPAAHHSKKSKKHAKAEEDENDE